MSEYKYSKKRNNFRTKQLNFFCSFIRAVLLNLKKKEKNFAVLLKILLYCNKA